MLCAPWPISWWRVDPDPLPAFLVHGQIYLGDDVTDSKTPLLDTIDDPADLPAALEAATAFDGPALVNVRLHPQAGRKPQQFGWLTT